MTESDYAKEAKEFIERVDKLVTDAKEVIGEGHDLLTKIKEAIQRKGKDEEEKTD